MFPTSALTLEYWVLGYAASQGSNEAIHVMYFTDTDTVLSIATTPSDRELKLSVFNELLPTGNFCACP